eukprot:TRINITY_DN14987_c0_g1_i3.p1 TRINITY_DN14987_c0_g1~~TRINITY_DN14987_c0_g1_i3.p1  ORF type:complete len:289 (+),score=11.25 TRINITY_DN14987_c0_g1_i3:76-942(+)
MEQQHSLPAASWVDQWLALPYLAALAVPTFCWMSVLGLVWLAPWWSTDFKKQGADRVLSTLHATATSIMGLVAEMTMAPTCTAVGSWVRAPMLVLLGFLVADLLSVTICDVINRWRPVDWSIIFHHCFIVTFFSIGYTHDCGIWFGVTLLINELSTPFVNAHWYITFTGQKEKPIYVQNGLAMLFSFTLCRILFIPFSFYQLASVGFCRAGGNPTYVWGSWVMGTGYVVLFLMNVMWWQKMVQGAVKKLFPAKSSSADSSNGAEQGSEVTAEMCIGGHSAPSVTNKRR